MILDRWKFIFQPEVAVAGTKDPGAKDPYSIATL